MDDPYYQELSAGKSSPSASGERTSNEEKAAPKPASEPDAPKEKRCDVLMAIVTVGYAWAVQLACSIHIWWDTKHSGIDEQISDLNQLSWNDHVTVVRTAAD